MNFFILTSYPQIYPGILSHGIPGKALGNQYKLNIIDIRKFDKTTHIDDSPFGGGPGMIMKPEPIHNAILSLPTNTKIIHTSPRGQILNQKKITSLYQSISSNNNNIAIICSSFEGIDQRIIQMHNIEEISIGDYILPNGDIAASVIISSIIRLIPNVLGNHESIINESFTLGNGNLLSHDQYTRPAIWNNIEVPKILLSGNHKEIQKWKLQNAKDNTKAKRPDMWQNYINENNIIEN